MSKIKITEAKCFEEVAKVIGRKNAQRELFIASQSKKAKFTHDRPLISAFYWCETPKGSTFWSEISKKSCGLSYFYECDSKPYEVDCD